uniref:Uncharacterized protein n=1 Tax=Phlebotomus papatasi TaxID=29031 RepID=A0A1B0DQX0_PHLPP
MDYKPRIYGDRVPAKLIAPHLRKVQQRIVMLHDYFRTKVIPPASNMLIMKWHHGAARAAQKWADQCRLLTHDSPKGRWIDNFGACGQNIFVSTQKVPWLFALRMWFSEKHNFTYGSPKNDLHVVGHYTQMVWAATHKVGCGLAKCARGFRGKSYYNYVCNYCPILCKNSCYAADLWANCHELNKWPGWLCNTATQEGLERRRNCLATCTCRHKIHD